MKKITFTFSMGFLLTTYACAKINDSSYITEQAKQFMKNNNVSGLSIATINHDHITTYNYGYANEKKHIKTSNNTIYRVASFSKTYTSTLMAIAQVEDRVNLLAPITNYIPQLHDNNYLRQVTPKRLLAHVASLPFEFTPPAQNYETAINDLNSYTPKHQPETKYNYSNISIGLNGYILQNVYHQDYSLLLKEKITKPLKLQSTYLNLPKHLESHVALGHQGDTLRPYEKENYVWFAAASLESTILDMAKFLRVQFNNNNSPIMSQAVKLVHQNYYCLAEKQSCEQLAWQAHDINELTNTTSDTYFQGINKTGKYIFAKQTIIPDNTLLDKEIFIDKTCGGYGMSGYMLYSPQKKVGVVILLNRSVGNERVRLGRNILQYMLKQSSL